jgi:hypothetical protein
MATKGKHQPSKNQEIDIEESTKDNIRRVPRPLGITQLNLTRLKLKKEGKLEEETKQGNKLKEICINIYVRDNFNWMGKMVPMNHFASYLNMRTEELMIQVNREIERISLWMMGEEGKALARGLLFKGAQKSLEILALASGQTQVLLAEQGDKYVPFLSAEVNRSIANLTGAHKPLMEVLKAMTEKSPINILINNNGKSGTSGDEYLTPEMALQLIHNNGSSMANDPTLIEAKVQEMGALPDVQARNQDLSTIGIKLPNKTVDSKGTLLHYEPKAEDFLK